MACLAQRQWVHNKEDGAPSRPGMPDSGRLAAGRGPSKACLCAARGSLCFFIQAADVPGGHARDHSIVPGGYARGRLMLPGGLAQPRQSAWWPHKASPLSLCTHPGSGIHLNPWHSLEPPGPTRAQPLIPILDQSNQV